MFFNCPGEPTGATSGSTGRRPDPLVRGRLRPGGEDGEGGGRGAVIGAPHLCDRGRELAVPTVPTQRGRSCEKAGARWGLANSCESESLWMLFTGIWNDFMVFGAFRSLPISESLDSEGGRWIGPHSPSAIEVGG